MGVNSLPKTVTRQATASRLRSEPRTFCAWVQHVNHSTTEPLQDVRRMLKSTESVCTWACWRLTEGLAGLGRSERGLSCRCNCFLYCTIIHRIHTTHYTSQRRQRPCCWVREWKKIKIGEYLAKLQAKAWLSRALCAPGRHTAKRRRKCTRQPRSCL